MPTQVIKKNGVVYETQLFLNTDNCVYVVADGVKTYATLLNELYALVDRTKISRNTKLVYSWTSSTFLHIVKFTDSGHFVFSSEYVYDASDSSIYTMELASSDSSFVKGNFISDAVTNLSSNVPLSGTTFSIYYNIVVSGQGMETSAQDVSYGNSNVKAALDGLNAAMPFKTLSTGMIYKNITGLANNTSIETDAWTPTAGLYLINIFINPLNVQDANPQVVITTLKNGTYYDAYSIAGGSDHTPSQAICQLVGSGKNWNSPLFLGSLIVALNGTDSFAVRMLNSTGAAISSAYNTSNFGFRFYKIRDL